LCVEPSLAPSPSRAPWRRVRPFSCYTANASGRLSLVRDRALAPASHPTERYHWRKLGPHLKAPYAPAVAGGGLIHIKARVRHRVHKCSMSEDSTFTNEVICPVCGRPMILLRTIRRAFAENLNVFKCKPCGFSTTEPVSWATPPSSQNVGAARHVAKRAGR
jgi:predicted RNA-binding Zn-ribbon protein involved in translation (DUF1610 family)